MMNVSEIRSMLAAELGPTEDTESEEATACEVELDETVALDPVTTVTVVIAV
jgi:hypothetical protein